MGPDCLIPLAICSAVFLSLLVWGIVLEVRPRRESACMIAQLRSNEQWIAYGRARTSWSVWKNGPIVLLVRSGNGDYYLVGKQGVEKTSILGFVHEVVISEAYRDPRVYLGIVTDTDMIFFDPVGFPPTKQGKPRKTNRMGKPKYVLRGIKAAGGVDLYQLCWNCFLPRRVDQERCSTAMCVDLQELEEEFGEASGEPAMARASSMVGGFGGGIIGLILYGILWVGARLFHAPQTFQDQLTEHWWIPAVALGTLGYLGLYVWMLRSAKKSTQQPA